MDGIMTGGGWALTLVCSQKAVAMADRKKRGMKWFIPSSWGIEIAYAPLGQSAGRKRKSAQVLPVRWQGGGGDGWCAWERGFYRVCTDSAKGHVTAVARACLELMSPPPSTQRSVSYFSQHHPSTWAEEKAARRDPVKAQVLFSTKPKSEWNVLQHVTSDGKDEHKYFELNENVQMNSTGVLQTWELKPPLGLRTITKTDLVGKKGKLKGAILYPSFHHGLQPCWSKIIQQIQQIRMGFSHLQGLHWQDTDIYYYYYYETLVKGISHDMGPLKYDATSILVCIMGYYFAGVSANCSCQHAHDRANRKIYSISTANRMFFVFSKWPTSCLSDGNPTCQQISVCRDAKQHYH